MPTKVHFMGGQEMVVAEEEPDVVAAVRRDHPNPVKLESRGGQPMHVNWTHVVWVEELPLAPE
jgi:hypothetical protein